MAASPPTLPLSTPLFPLLSSQPQLLQLTLSLLHAPQLVLAPHTPALNVLLFLLDGIRFLRTDPLLMKLVGVGELDSEIWEEDDEDGQWNKEWKRWSTGPGAGNTPAPPTVADGSAKGSSQKLKGGMKRVEEEEPPTWDEWRAYIEEMYLHPMVPSSSPTSSPSLSDPAPATFTTSATPPTSASTWRSPFCIPPSLIPSLPFLCSNTANPPPHIGTLRTCLLSALFHLSTEPATTALLALVGSPKGHAMLSAPVIHSITSTLASLRRSTVSSTSGRGGSSKGKKRKGVAAERPNPLQTFRSILSTLLGVSFHSKFGVKPGDEGCVYARSGSDDHAIMIFWDGIVPAEPAPATDSPSEEEEEDDFDEEEESIHEVRRTSMGGGITSGGEREARRSIVRKDDKLRWIFGENFQHRRLSAPNPSTSAHSSPSSSRRSSPRAPPLPILPRSSGGSLSIHSQTQSSSFASLPGSYSTASPYTVSRSRHMSLTSLESIPLSLAPSTSTQAHFPASSSSSGKHQRGYSVSSTTPLLPPPPSPDGTTKPSVTQSPPSPTPFSSLALAPGPAPIEAYSYLPTLGGPLPRSSSEGAIPPTTNHLSAMKKRELVRKSRKLGNLFGVPLEEEAAGLVLVSQEATSAKNHWWEGAGRGGGGPLKDRRMSFPPHASPFAVEPSSLRERSSIVSLLTVGGGGGSGGSIASVGMGRSNSSPMSFGDPTANGSENDEREKRRRKMNKLQRMLGEKVTAEMIGAITPRNHSWAGGSSVSLPGALSRATGGGEWREGFDLSPAPLATRIGTAGRAGGVREMNSARKLEQVFGQLPPRSLYLPPPLPSHQRSLSSPPLTPTPTSYNYENPFNPASPYAARPPRKVESYRASIKSLQWLAERDLEGLGEVVGKYSTSDTISISSASEAEDDSAMEGATFKVDDLLDDDDDDDENDSRGRKGKLPRPTTRDSAASSVGSAWEVPVDFEITGRVIQSRSASREGENRDGESDEEEELDDDAIKGKAREVERSERRTARKAIKLASLLGTTKGEVWTMLLNDLAVAIKEEDELDDEERREVLDGVEKLRDKGKGVGVGLAS